MGVFGIEDWVLQKELNKIPSLSEETQELEEALTKVAQNKGYKNFNVKGLILELKRIEGKGLLLNYPKVKSMDLSNEENYKKSKEIK